MAGKETLEKKWIGEIELILYTLEALKQAINTVKLKIEEIEGKN